MLKQGYYFKNRKSDEILDGFGLFVTGVGRFRQVSLPQKHTNYPARAHFQLLYIKKGVCHYNCNGIEGKAYKDSVVIWPQYTPKQWLWFLKDEPDVYWVEFGGNAAENTLQKLGLLDSLVLPLSGGNALTDIFENIMQELQYRQTNYCELCEALLKQLLLTVSRNYEAVKRRKKPLPPEIIRTVQYMEEHCCEEIYLETLAEMNFVCKSWLIRQFKRYLGVTPMQYLNDLRLEKAERFLQEGADIETAARLSGFLDRLYFSKVFKKKTGLSPGKYRKMNIE